MNIKELTAGTRFVMGGKTTVYTAAMVRPGQSMTTVEYFIGTNTPGNRFMFTKPSLTTVKVVL